MKSRNDKLAFAMQKAVESATRNMRGFASKCADLHGSNEPKSGTNPISAETSQPRGKTAPEKPSDSHQALRCLSPRQHMAVGLLISGRSIVATARELGVNASTVQRWKSNPHFVAEVRRRTGADSQLKTPPQRPTSASKADQLQIAMALAKKYPSGVVWK